LRSAGLPAAKRLVGADHHAWRAAAAAGIRAATTWRKLERRFYTGGDVLTAIDGEGFSNPLDVNLA